MPDVLEITDLDELRNVIEKSDVVVIDFTAPSWCVPCQRLRPHFRAAAEQTNAVFVEVDVDKAPNIANEFNIMSVPTVLLYRDGEYLKTLESRTVVKLLEELSHYN